MSAPDAQLGGTGLTEKTVSRVAELTLICGVALAVLAFGGTEPASFALVEILLMGAAALLIARAGRDAVHFSAKTLLVPAVLAAVVLLQLCPLPLGAWERLAPGENSTPGVGLARLTIEPYSTRAHFLILLTCIIAFYLAQIAARDRQHKRRLIRFVTILGAFEAFYGLVQYLTGWQKIFAYVKKYDLEEATGTYINRNHYAGFLGMVLPFSLALVFYEYESLRRNPLHPAASLKKLMIRPNLEKLIFWQAVAVVIFAGIIFSRSRMGIVAASASLFVIFGLSAFSRFHGKMGHLLSASFLVVSICLALWIGPGAIVARFASVSDEYTLKDQSRLSIWRDDVRLIRQHLWLGTGFGTFPIAFTAVQTTFLGKFVNHAHNDYLEVASDLGLPAALVLFASVVFALARAIVTSLSAQERFERLVALGCAGSIVAVLLHSLVDFNLYIPANALFFSMILGLAMATPPRQSMARSEAR